MSKPKLEELESRLLLSGGSLSSAISLSPASLTVTGASSTAGHAGLIQPGASGGEMGPAQSSVIASFGTGGQATGVFDGMQGQVMFDFHPASNLVLTNLDVERLPALESWNGGYAPYVQPPRFAGTLVEGDWAAWNFAGLPSVLIIEFVPVSLEVTTNFDAQRPASPVMGNTVNSAPPEHFQTNFVSAVANPPLTSGFEITAPTADFSIPAARASFGPLPVLMLGVGTGALYSANGSQLPTAPQFAGNSPSSESTGPIGTPAQVLPSAPQAAAVATNPLLAESRVIDAYGILPKILPFLELSPQGQQEAPLPQLGLSALKAGLSQFMAGWSPQGQQALSLPPPDLANLESGLLQFLTDLGETSSQLIVGPDRTSLRMWLLAAAGAGAACAIAYRQQRRSAKRDAVEILSLPGCSLDDAF